MAGGLPRRTMEGLFGTVVRQLQRVVLPVQGRQRNSGECPGLVLPAAAQSIQLRGADRRSSS